MWDLFGLILYLMIMSLFDAMIYDLYLPLSVPFFQHGQGLTIWSIVLGHKLFYISTLVILIYSYIHMIISISIGSCYCTIRLNYLRSMRIAHMVDYLLSM